MDIFQGLLYDCFISSQASSLHLPDPKARITLIAMCGTSSLTVAFCIAPFSVGIGSSPLDCREAIQVISQCLAGDRKLYMGSNQVGWDAKGILGDPGARVK